MGEGVACSPPLPALCDATGPTTPGRPRPNATPQTPLTALLTPHRAPQGSQRVPGVAAALGLLTPAQRQQAGASPRPPQSPEHERPRPPTWRVLPRPGVREASDQPPPPPEGFHDPATPSPHAPDRPTPGGSTPSGTATRGSNTPAGVRNDRWAPKQSPCRRSRRSPRG